MGLRLGFFYGCKGGSSNGVLQGGSYGFFGELGLRYRLLWFGC